MPFFIDLFSKWQIMTVVTLAGKGLNSFPSMHSTYCYYKMFDRYGGVSDGRYSSLNIGKISGDEEKHVKENRQRVRTTMDVSTLLFAKQVHGNNVYCLSTQLEGDTEIDGVDALVTDQTDVGLVIQQADCQAVLLFDPERDVIAAIHCGWRGSVQQIIARTILVMTEQYGSKPANIRAVISPSLGPCCAEFINYKKELPEDFYRFMVSGDRFDFWQISRYQLVCAGLVESHIRTAAICTCCSPDYFSYRRASRTDGGVTGRNCSVIMLNDNGRQI